MVVIASVAGIAVALAALVVAGAAAFRILRIPEASNDSRLSQKVAEVRADLDALTLEVKKLPPLWEHERALAQAAKDEATKQHRLAAQRERTYRNTRERNEARDSEPDEGRDFLEAHASGSREEGLLTVPEDVEGDSQDDLTQRALAAGWSPWV